MRSEPKLGNACAWRPSMNAASESISAAVTTPWPPRPWMRTSNIAYPSAGSCENLKTLRRHEQHRAVPFVHDSPADAPDHARALEPATAHHDEGSVHGAGRLDDHAPGAAFLKPDLACAPEGQLQPVRLLFDAAASSFGLQADRVQQDHVGPLFSSQVSGELDQRVRVRETVTCDEDATSELLARRYRAGYKQRSCERALRGDCDASFEYSTQPTRGRRAQGQQIPLRSPSEERPARGGSPDLPRR